MGDSFSWTMSLLGFKPLLYFLVAVTGGTIHFLKAEFESISEF